VVISEIIEYCDVCWYDSHKPFESSACGLDVVVQRQAVLSNIWTTNHAGQYQIKVQEENSLDER
jgi:hypothetical protein